MNGQPDGHSIVSASHTVALLDARAAELRAELLKLRQQLAEVEGDLSDSQAARLLEANQKLVLAVLQADRTAEVAVANLAAANDSHQRDALTGVLTRALGIDRLENAIDMARRNGKRLAVLFLDLDHFKAVNDHLGHASGDQVLQMTAQRLQSVLRDSDTVSRYGGDEFMLILPDVSGAADVGLLASDLLAALIMPGAVGGHTLQQSASLGISLYPDDGEDATTLIQRADAAMYRCKRRGSAGFEFYTPQDVDEGRGELPPGLIPASSTSHVDVLAISASRQQDLREANEQLVMSSLVAQESEAQARQAHRQQIAFMAMVAHELRNPLTPLRLATDMLTNRGLANEVPIERLATLITSQIARMARLIDDLLDGSRLSTGKLRLEFDEVDVLGVLDQAIMACRPGMHARQQQFSADLLSGPLNVHGDPIRLAQIFSNLLDNASKYTPEGGEIALGMTLVDHTLSIFVRDNGVGITDEMLPQIFDLFVQDAQVLAHSSGGLGIGLAVVRELVEGHGGTVTAHSAGRNLGSEFVVTLPLA
ncbi:diguanylate cyclase [Rhodanobacter sp. AS-Z3]|uniref:diguanylate cyclase domain-containing protein n=1 Tax=Rhodanobacter sp. AS-Z3 TaxID=3031330 RepID=UPI00247AA424|nr:diguanylate cyclase [Rhodanobacter sp. AS-Z3]WEN16564.1 diguanylate cyclase [Rhodanobacter sp. AS-Z3]